MSRGQGATHHRAVIVLALAAVLACSSGAAAADARPPRSRPAPGGPAPPPGAVPCQGYQLDARLTARPPTPGREHVLLVLSNQGSRSCGMFGFVGLELLGPDGSALATDLQRAGTSRPATEVVVPPAGEAAALLSWATFSVDEACVAPTGVEVTPPNDTTPLVLPWPTSGLVCRLGQIDLEPVHPITARPRSAAAMSGAQAAAPSGPIDFHRGRV